MCGKCGVKGTPCHQGALTWRYWSLPSKS